MKSRRTSRVLTGVATGLLVVWVVASVTAGDENAFVPMGEPWRAAWYGSRVPLIATLVATVVSLGAGIPLGWLSFRSGGPRDRVVRRSLTTLGSIPALFMAAMFVAVFPGSQCMALGLGVGLSRLAEVALLVRIQAIRFTASPAHEAAIALGASPWDVWSRHVAPRLLAPLSQSILHTVASVTVVDAAAHFLHLEPSSSRAVLSWGSVIASAYWNQPMHNALPSLLAAVSTVSAALVLTTVHRELADPYLVDHERTCVS